MRHGQLALVTNESMPPRDTAQTVVSDAVDEARAVGLPVSRRSIGMLAKQAKELLEDGFDGDCLRFACWLAIQQNAPHRLTWIAGDVAGVQAGTLMDSRTYRQRLQDEVEIAAASKRKGGLFGR